MLVGHVYSDACHFLTPGARFILHLLICLFSVSEPFLLWVKEEEKPDIHVRELLWALRTSWFKTLTASVTCDLQMGSHCWPHLWAAGWGDVPATLQSPRPSLHLGFFPFLCSVYEGSSSCIFGCPGDVDRRESVKVPIHFSLVPQEADFLLSNEKPEPAALGRTGQSSSSVYISSFPLFKPSHIQTLKLHVFVVSVCFVFRRSMKHSLNKCDEFILSFWIAKAWSP